MSKPRETPKVDLIKIKIQGTGVIGAEQGAEANYVNENWVTEWRVKTLFEKEPETMRWMQRNFGPGEVFIDIGANIGLYTIWAAAIQNTKVWAFEPESCNYKILNENIYYNKLSRMIRAYPIALGKEQKLGHLNLSMMLTGGSDHMFHNLPARNRFAQGCISMRLDDVVKDLQIKPNYIKIDVDGLEPDVIAGALKTLKLPSMKSVLCEIDQNNKEHMKIRGTMKRLGYGYDQYEVDEVTVKEGAFKGYANYIFRK